MASWYLVRYRTQCKKFFVMKPKTAEKSDSTHPKRQNESTRERVLEAAFTLFCEGGFSDVRMLEIATRAQVSKRDLYALFRNKQAVLADCIKERARRLRGRLGEGNRSEITIGHIYIEHAPVAASFTALCHYRVEASIGDGFAPHWIRGRDKQDDSRHRAAPEPARAPGRRSGS